MKKEEKEEKIDWHKILQKILDEHLPLMSGKEIEKGEREFQQYFLVDYYCKTKKSEKKQGFVPKIKPFEHLKEHRIKKEIRRTTLKTSSPLLGERIEVRGPENSSSLTPSLSRKQERVKNADFTRLTTELFKLFYF